MFNSQVLDVAIGLVLMFFVLALTSSSIVEAISGILKIRSKQLENGIVQIVDDPDFIYSTSIYSALAGSAGRPPSYISAKAFADAVVEGITTAKSLAADANALEDLLPAPLKTRLTMLTHQLGSDVTSVKAGIEHWFDEVMDRVSGSYKRWSQIILFLVGLVLTIGLNASTTHVAGTLWHEPAVRDAVTQAARGEAEAHPTSSPDISKIADDVKSIDSLGLPIGWHAWDANAGPVLTPIGWLVTAFLILLGAPFWYGFLTQLISLRSAGNKPPLAADDPTSATAATTATTASVALVPAAVAGAALGGPPPAPPAPSAAAPAAPVPLSDLLDRPEFGPYAPSSTG